ncbi:MAG: hypothetical protein R2724_08575 [Bryobacterales bacterium]
MLYCHFRDPVNQDIREAVVAGLSTPDILSKIYAKYGEMLRTEPVAVGLGRRLGNAFRCSPLGLVIAPFVVKRWRANQARRRNGLHSCQTG